MTAKKRISSQGVVATANLATIYQRQIFFQVDPMSLDHMDWTDIQDLQPSSFYFEFDPNKYLGYLPEIEAEIFYLFYFREKSQKDIAVLLGLSQPTISYRFRRTIVKLGYIMTLVSLDVEKFINDFAFLKEQEKSILLDLFYYTNQEMVGKKHNVRQSSVKWIFVKTKRRIADMERKDSDRWFNHLGLLILLERNLNTRVQY